MDAGISVARSKAKQACFRQVGNVSSLEAFMEMPISKPDSPSSLISRDKDSGWQFCSFNMARISPSCMVARQQEECRFKLFSVVTL